MGLDERSADPDHKMCVAPLMPGDKSSVILTVTLNFALDITYGIDEIRYGETVRVPRVGRRAGGKGVNAARVLHALGRDVVVTGFAGGFNGLAARAELREAGLTDATVEVDAESRLTLMLVDARGAATGFSELGPEIAPLAWDGLLAHYDTLLDDAEAVIIAGSVPPGVPSDGCGQLVAGAVKRGVPVLVDTDGEHLRGSLSARPDVVKINRAELFGVVAGDDVIAGARELCRAGARSAVISMGAEGMVALRDGGVLRAAPPRTLTGNPTGAGDAASAALAVALADGRPWEQAVADACALSAAAVLAPQAGSFDAHAYARLREEVAVRATGAD